MPVFRERLLISSPDHPPIKRPQDKWRALY
jgi:hypothetical protein